MDMMNFIHIDEKWFYMTKIKENYYLLQDETPPERSIKSKRFITKVMFMAAGARPRFDFNKKHLFDGKIGIWAFIYEEEAKQNSKNRDKGTMETKAVTSVTKDVVRQMLLDKVIPAIKSKWPSGTRNLPIIIQQDNAKPHCAVDDPELVEAMTENNWKISIRCQPPNSPDLNVLDLGYFNSIQSLQHKKVPRTIDDLVSAVNESFLELTSESLQNVFLSLQMAMDEIIQCEGGNNYKLGHMSKAKLSREGRLPANLVCRAAVLDETPPATSIASQSQGTAEPVIPITATVSTVTVSVPNGCKLFSDCHSGENVNCIYCREITTAAHYCSLCLYVVHAICGTSDGEEGYGKPVKCFRCLPM